MEGYSAASTSSLKNILLVDFTGRIVTLKLIGEKETLTVMKGCSATCQ